MEPSPSGERSRVISSPTATESELRPALSRATSIPASYAATCRDGSGVSSFVRPAGQFEHPPPSQLGSMALAPALASSGLPERLATSAMRDGKDVCRVAVPRARVLTVPEPSYCCSDAVCAQNMPFARMDRISDRLTARRRGIRQSNGKSLADLPVRVACVQPPAGPNGPALSTGLIVHNDCLPVSALEQQDVRHDRPAATDVARPLRVGRADASECCHSIRPRRVI